jgi:hypothetical protein
MKILFDFITCHFGHVIRFANECEACPSLIRFKSYPRCYYLAPFTVFDSFSHPFLPCQCLFTCCVVWCINLRTKSIIFKSQEKSFIMTILRNKTDVYKPNRHVPWCSPIHVHKRGLTPGEVQDSKICDTRG